MRGTLIASGVSLALAVVVTLLLIGQGKRDAKIHELQADLSTASRALKTAADDIRRFGVREGEAATVAAQVCQAESGDAFARGRAFGRAEAAR